MTHTEVTQEPEVIVRAAVCGAHEGCPSCNSARLMNDAMLDQLRASTDQSRVAVLEEALREARRALQQFRDAAHFSVTDDYRKRQGEQAEVLLAKIDAALNDTHSEEHTR